MSEERRREERGGNTNVGGLFVSKKTDPSWISRKRREEKRGVGRGTERGEERREVVIQT